MAAQLIGTKRPVAPRDQAWMSRAVTSLPVPVSPVSSTGIEVARHAGHLRDQPCEAALFGDEQVAGRRRRGRHLQFRQPPDQPRRGAGLSDWNHRTRRADAASIAAASPIPLRLTHSHAVVSQVRAEPVANQA